MPRRKRKQSLEEQLDSDFDVDIETLSEDTADTESNRSYSSPPRKPSLKSPDAVTPRKGVRRSGRINESQSSQESPKECCLCFGIDEDQSDEVKEMVMCSECGNFSHQSCLGMSYKMLSIVKTYPWQCLSCKTCEKCNSRRPKCKLRFCNNCDRSFHTFCMQASLVVDAGKQWTCQICLDEPLASVSKTDPKETKVMKLDSETDAETNLSKTSPSKKCGKQKKNQTFFKKRRSKFNGMETKNDENIASTESEESEGSSLSDGSPCALIVKEPDYRTVKTSFQSFYVKSSAIRSKCPTQGCDGKGHLTGRFSWHHTLSGCPMHHKTTAEECRLKAEEREKEMKEKHTPKREISKRASANLNATVEDTPRRDLRRQMALSFMPEKVRAAVGSAELMPNNLDRCKGSPAASSRTISSIKDNLVVPESHVVPREELKEELLKGLTSEYDLNLFKSAWEKAAEVNEEEASVPVNGRPVCRCVVFGMYEINTWYSSPYPEEYQRLKKIYICEFCLKYMKSPTILRRHMAKCIWKNPPGQEIYRKTNLSVFEVDGKKHKTYCQNLCLMAKLFLDHKTLYYDVEPFLFYIMTKADNVGCRFIGYFSKEKKSFLNYNVSCILTFPAYMKQGYGKMLIDFSYLLSKVEGKVGSPEKPLSDLGLISYRSYWKMVVIKYLQAYGYDKISVRDISQETAIHPNDIVSTLQYLGILKYWKGKHVVLRSKELYEEYNKKVESRPANYQEIDPACLRWVPPVTMDNKP